MAYNTEIFELNAYWLGTLTFLFFQIAKQTLFLDVGLKYQAFCWYQVLVVVLNF